MANIDRYSTYITKKYRVTIYIYFEKKYKMCRKGMPDIDKIIITIFLKNGTRLDSWQGKHSPTF